MKAPEGIFLEYICNKFIDFWKTVNYDLIYKKTKELGWKDNRVFRILAFKNLKEL
jgi:hypothetical protein